MNDDATQRLQSLSITDSEASASNPTPAQVHAVAGLDLALASLRELIGENMVLHANLAPSAM